jgi:hypothetical protein
MTSTMTRVIHTFVATAVVATASVAVGAAPAQAVSGWTTVTGQEGVAIVLACKRPVDSPYGPLWEINVASLSTPDRIASIELRVTRYGQQVNGVTVTARNGEWRTGITYASRILPDRLTGTAGTGVISTGQGAGAGIDPTDPASWLVTCQ